MRITEKVTEEIEYNKYLYTKCDVCGNESGPYDKFVGVLCSCPTDGKLETKDVCSFDCFEKILESLGWQWLNIKKINNPDTLRSTHKK